VIVEFDLIGTNDGPSTGRNRPGVASGSRWSRSSSLRASIVNERVHFDSASLVTQIDPMVRPPAAPPPPEGLRSYLLDALRPDAEVDPADPASAGLPAGASPSRSLTGSYWPASSDSS
jgi:hypothetical protein